MEYGLFDLLTLLGSLGFFLYGMKLMSESLQKVAGDRMRNILAAMTANRFRGVLTGLIITAIIQSSSATTVMLVSFVNAGLITLTESIGVVMGASIGTTATVWLITALGLKVKMGTLVLPLIGISLPLLFSKKTKHSDWSEVIIGFAIIFVGLDFLKEATPDIHSNPAMLEFLTQYSTYGYASIMIFLALGAILTLVIQSSSAVMALTLVMCFNGWINFEMAAAMVLGMNIGTTITAILAALMANTDAKRTAMVHLIFKVLGVIIALLVFSPSLRLVDAITIKAGLPSPLQEHLLTGSKTNVAIPVALAIYHSTFNILNTLVMIWFVPQLEQIAIRLVKDKHPHTEELIKKEIKTTILSTSELSILKARKDIATFMQMTEKMYKDTLTLNTTSPGEEYKVLFRNIKHKDKQADRIEIDITSYLVSMTSSSSSLKSAKEFNSMLRLISNIESVADACYGIAKSIDKRNKSSVKFDPEIDTTIQKLLNLNKEMLDELSKNFDGMKGQADQEIIEEIYEQQNTLHLQVQKEHHNNIKSGLFDMETGLLYAYTYNQLSRMKEALYKVSKATNYKEFLLHSKQEQ